ncbi:HAD-IB family phosphatase [Pseudovibrio sp. SPO723]|uniref:HAD family hydrolase n=1 Tax=Nesiotobacter zosterae TaxID=392721 RepID=UPI0029C13232|nr:HAD-IB family phosphatase [Pseudovibrio sp. SPO723]MDX5595689.1 HAD-IB family phosphatase [Pseudovibrio sp. SPO723]
MTSAPPVNSEAQPAGYAFFDVDETIVVEKTMFTILHVLGERFKDLDASGLIEQLHQLRSLGRERAEVNRHFYKGLAGLPRNEVAAAARAYIYDRIAEDGYRRFFIRNTIAQLEALRHKGVEPVFVSGSACDFLEALAEHLEVKHVLATQLVVSETGHYTGEIAGRCMIGHGKKEAVTEFLAARAMDPALCFGVGDHPSDADFISLLGSGAMLTGNAESERLARQHNWTLIDNDWPAKEVA